MAGPVRVEWEGEVVNVREDQAFALCEAIEEVITLPELIDMLNSGKPKFRKLSRAYAEMLRFCGFMVTPDDVLKAVMAGFKDGSDEYKVLSDAVRTLVVILMDGAPEEEDVEVSSGPTEAP